MSMRMETPESKPIVGLVAAEVWSSLTTEEIAWNALMNELQKFWHVKIAAWYCMYAYA